MRCQSLLSYKLFKLKMRETKEMVQYLQDHFTRHPTLELPPVVSSPQLSTPSPHSPTSSPAASSSLHPSPHHHPSQIMTTIPRNVYSNMQKTCGSAMHLISAHELWDAADGLVEKYRVEGNSTEININSYNFLNMCIYQLFFVLMHPIWIFSFRILHTDGSSIWPVNLTQYTLRSRAICETRSSNNKNYRVIVATNVLRF